MTTPSRLSIAVITPTWNRAELLPQLHMALTQQTDPDFIWLVVDDASTDGTGDTLRALRGLGVHLTVINQPRNGGKAAALNAAFDALDTDVFLVIDSDDLPYANAIQTVRSKAEKYAADPGVGALFFRYDCGGSVLGPELPQGDRVLSRAENDRTVGKYDGAVAYFGRALESLRYPVYPGEVYVGPTVLQLRMHPRYRIAFVNLSIGEAEYRAGGLTASGRSLRVANPRGMTEYSRLQHEQAGDLRTRLITGTKMHAYASLSGSRLAVTSLEGLVLRSAGALLGRYWKCRYGRPGASL